MAILIMPYGKKGLFTNKNAVENLIKYITRTRLNEQRASELIAYGGPSIGNYYYPEEIIAQFLGVQNLYNINNRCGRRMYHEILSFTDTEFKYLNYNYEVIKSIAAEICKIFFDRGHQVLYGIHFSEEQRLHIHFAVNTINFRTGLKLHSTKTDLEERERYCNQIIMTYCYRLQNVIAPITFGKYQSEVK